METVTQNVRTFDDGGAFARARNYGWEGPFNTGCILRYTVALIFLFKKYSKIILMHDFVIMSFSWRCAEFN